MLFVFFLGNRLHITGCYGYQQGNTQCNESTTWNEGSCIAKAVERTCCFLLQPVFLIRPFTLLGGCCCEPLFPLRSYGGGPLGCFPSSTGGPWAKLAAWEEDPAHSLNWPITREQRGWLWATPQAFKEDPWFALAATPLLDLLLLGSLCWIVSLVIGP